jgi:hypothetical protein
MVNWLISSLWLQYLSPNSNEVFFPVIRVLYNKEKLLLCFSDEISNNGVECQCLCIC